MNVFEIDKFDFQHLKMGVRQLKKKAKSGTDNRQQTDIAGRQQTDIADSRLNRPKDRFSEHFTDGC